MSDDLLEMLKLVEQLERRKQIYRASYYAPYGFQERFHHVEGFKQPGKLAIFRALIAANGIGKTLCGCMEDSYHLTGQYPKWWKGHWFGTPISLIASGLTNESVRDILQKELFGDPNDDSALGTGTIPIDCIGKITKKPGIANAFDSVKIKHVTGRWSTLFFRAYEQGWKKFMGTRYEVFHADEEPPEDIWDQLIRALMSKKKAIGYLTLTPEEGVTAVVNQFMNYPTEGMAYVNAGWKDAPHMVGEDGQFTEQARIIASKYSGHQLEMRTKGIPLSGEGLVFNVPDDKIVVAPFQIPPYWTQIVGIDFGWDHPFAAARIAYDRDNDCIYLVSEYRESKALPAIHAQAIEAWGGWQPVTWPHDGLNTEKGTGDELIRAYRDLGLNCLPQKATNPPEPGKLEGTGGNSVEASIQDMLIRMETGRFKVFSTCQLFLEEKRMYHRKDGKIVKLSDDITSACRYACMSVRHAKTNKPKELGRTSTARDGTKYLSAMPKKRR